MSLPVDREQLGGFVAAMFCHADEDTFASLRTFLELEEGPPVDIKGIRLNGDPTALAKVAIGRAQLAADCETPSVFAPPIATFSNARRAREVDLANGLVLSVELDKDPAKGRKRLEYLLGTATAVVASGGEWIDPSTGEVQPRLHAHWRLREPTRTPEAHARLKQARSIATALVGGDCTSKSVVHPLRWPGSWHRKAEPKLCQIIALNPEAEIDLHAALSILHDIQPEFRRPNGATAGDPGDPGEDRDTDELVQRIISGDEYHSALRDLAWRYLKGGMKPPQVVLTLRGLMDASTGPHDERWQKRYSQISMLVSTAQEKAAGEQKTGWPPPLDIIGAPELVGWPQLTEDCLPAAVYRYVTSEADRLNVDPCPVAAHVLAACATTITDAWCVKPKLHDRWTQQARIWCCVVKEVGARGTDMLRAAFWPIQRREKQLRARWKQEMAAWEERQQLRKKGDKTPDPPPVCHRITTQDATIEAASQILAHGNEHSKLTFRCDELVSFLSAAGRYSSNGAAARAYWLEAYDGGPQQIDRVIRGNVFVPNWSIIVTGNIQPRRLAGLAKDLTDDGMFQRFMTIHTPPVALGQDDDPPLPAAAGHAYSDLLEALRELQPPTGAEGELRPAFFDAEARAVRRNFKTLIERLQVDQSLPTIIRETAPKWSGLLARLSLIFHLVELAEQSTQGSPPEPAELCAVTGHTVEKAAAFLQRIALPNLFRLGFETMPEEGAPAGHARWIAGHILANQLQQIRGRGIGRVHRPLRGKPLDTQQAMAVLCDAGWTREKDGRHDSQHWLVNPAVHNLFATAAAAEKTAAQRLSRSSAAGSALHDPSTVPTVTTPPCQLGHSRKNEENSHGQPRRRR